MTTQSTDGRNRDSLGFADAARQHIAPVLTVRGFACSEATPYVVKFVSSTVALAIFHDPVSYEIEVALARRGAPSQQFGLRDILDVALEPEQEDRGFFQASERRRVSECVSAIGDILGKCVQSAITYCHSASHIATGSTGEFSVSACKRR